MTSSIELLSPGERPTEAGWYVVKERWGGADILNVLPSENEDVLTGYYSGNPEPQPLSLFTFIARIYPDRIGQERTDEP